MKSFIIIVVCFIIGLFLIAQNTQEQEIKRKILQNRLENASLKPVLNPTTASLSEMGIIYPSGNYGARGGLKHPEKWNELILIAAFLNTECRNCNYKEKKLILEALRNRVEQNYDGFGESYFEQIFARRYDKKNERWQVQFSGVGKPDNFKKYFFYQRNDPHCVENYKAVWEVIIEGERTLPCNVTDFIFPSAATIEKEVERQARNRYKPYENFYDGMYHRLAYCRKIKCDTP